MEKNKILLVGGIAALLAFGLVMAANAMNGFGRQPMGFPNGQGFMPGGCGGHGDRTSLQDNMRPPENATHEGFMLGGGGRYGNKTSLQEELGLPENATFEQISDATWEKEFKDLGLTDDSTLGEYRQAVEAQRQAMEEKMKTQREESMQNIREKLNLPENATQEDIQEAMQEWREENKELMPWAVPGKRFPAGFGMMRRRGFGINK